MRFRFLEKTRLRIIILAAFILFVFTGYGLAQTEGDTIWTKAYGDALDQMAYSVEQTSDGGFVVAGLTNGFDTADFWLIRTDSNGDTLWTRTYGTADNEQAQSVKQTGDGGYIIAGWVSTPSLVYNLYVVRADANGDTVWTWRYAGHDYAYAYDVEETPDGGYVIVGKTGYFLMDYNAYLIKLNANGDTLWTQVYGGPDHQEGFDVELTLDGGYVITGETGTCPDYDVYLIKTDANGDSLWGHTYGGSLIDIGYSVKATSDGGYIIAGCTESWTPAALDAYFIKTDSNGDTLWTKRYGGILTDEVFSIDQTFDGNYVATGYYGTGTRDTDIYFIKLDPNGDTLWTGLYGGFVWDMAYSVIQAANGSFLIAGGSCSFGAGLYDVYLVDIAGRDLYGSIAGYVTDDIDRAPIENVRVSTDQSETWTDRDGYYNTSDLLIGRYDVAFSHPDYIDTIVTGVDVVYGRETRMDVTMAQDVDYDYLPGDANMVSGQWPPKIIGSDVTFLVSYFRQVITPCFLDGFFASGDVSGDCQIIGSDVTRLVSYFRGTADIEYCVDYEPAWLTPDDLPAEAPEGWPNCDAPEAAAGELQSPANPR